MMTNNHVRLFFGWSDAFVSHCRHKEEPRHWAGGCGVSASHLAHLIVLSGLTVVPLGLCLPRRLPLGLPLAAVPVLVGVLRLVLHLGVSVLLRSPPLQSAWKWFGRGKFRVTAWCVHTTDLNEASHEHDEGNTHQ